MTRMRTFSDTVGKLYAYIRCMDGSVRQSARALLDRLDQEEIMAGGFKKALNPSADLAAVIGKEAQPRTQVTKKLWDYIKANGLQDQIDKRQINADAALKKVFGGKAKVSMFEMTKLVSAHLTN